ncbi:MAG: response regulator [bacterium]|nr:response regulator [bacterium]
MAKVLLVEPQKELREMYSTLIESAGFDVATAMDAREGQDRLHKEKITACIISSPKQEILWFLGVVRSSHTIAISTLPILVVLEDITDNSVDYIEAGASKCLLKFPSSGEKLIEQLRSILNIPKIQTTTK